MMEVVNSHNPNGGGWHKPDRITYHVMGEWIRDDDGTIYTAEQWLKHIGLSSHALVTTSPAGIIIRTRDDNEIAYHVKNDNTGNLGIEFLCPGIHNLASLIERTKTDYLVTAQYWAGVEQVRQWREEYGIPVDRVQPHSVLDPDNRWFDPGAGFPHDIFIEDIQT